MDTDTLSEDLKNTYISQKTIIQPIGKHKFIFNYIIEENVYEKLYNLLDAYVENITNKNFVEIGGDFGLQSIKFSEYAKTVYTFETDRLVYNQLCGNIYINNIENIIPFNYGISQYEGKILSDTGEPIFLQTLDSFNIQNIGLILINSNVFSSLLGSYRTIRNNYPILIYNSNNIDTETSELIFKFLSDLCYKQINTIDNFVVMGNNTEIMGNTKTKENTYL